MNDDIPFAKSFELPHGQVQEVFPGVRRLVAPNAGPFTFTGTVTYIVGRGRVAIIDPGPAEPGHIAAVLAAVRGETVTHIVVTHTHRDHSPAAASIKAATGAPTYAEGAHRPSRPLHIGETKRLDAGGDQDFRPDHTLADGERIEGDGWALEAVATPGHTANHMAFALAGTDILFSGDHVMGWSTSIVAPPDGAMRDYMQSLEKLRGRPEDIYLPGHGPEVRDARRLVRHFLQHRKGREAAILRHLGREATEISTLVGLIYVGLDPRLVGAAALSVLAHLEDLVARGVVATNGDPAIGNTYWLAAG
ncbi:MAG TPA: MBL fold metallo-hydrolase [Xanthobacteraceae bacterium]|nr:MBL fold metallo-hydrolase [Xanthobacteraceae bacterium]